MWSQPTAWCPWHVSRAECMPGSEGPPDWTWGHRSKSLSPLVTRSSWGTDEHTKTGSTTLCTCVQTPGVFAQGEALGCSEGALSTEQVLDKCAVQLCPPLLQRASLKCKGTSRACDLRKHWGSPPPWGNTRTTCCEQASRHSHALETQKASVVREDFVCPF